MNQIMYPKIRQPMMKNPKKAYLINKNMRDNKGRYLPLMAVEFQEGFIVVDGALSPDIRISQRIVDQRNELLGLSKTEAKKIIASTHLEFYSLN